ncbi:nitronate monooxygenase [Terrimonas sp. NA20]|uniref:Propionate 3-nitronate monooxygenase n=1 Tax=Terrimonas ginsenosidimutans TaxID=2908004 RepID=A0ABS9KTX3_9BACT|nr:nitronate monooxygenase [Terrimonas ginsenosidimutans]MCG2615729.1 nitronate monooxygenase [Terrimonas ginsenosidimutans]
MNWQKTRVTESIGIDYPILQGPFGGGFSSVKLLSTVSNAGGLGAYGAYTLSPQEIYETDKQIKAATNKPYNINLWVSDTDTKDGSVSDDQYEKTKKIFQPYFDELGIPVPPKPAPFQSRFENQLQVILDIKPKVFSYMFGTLPEDVLQECRKRGIKTVGTATTLDEAITLEATGTDMIIATGFEAGGHRPSFLEASEQSLTGTFVLLQLMREKIKAPVISAGGIADSRGAKAAFLLGADAVQVGTAFLACEESNASPLHRQMLFSDAAKQTALTRSFTGRLGRGLSGRLVKELLAKEAPHLPFPLQTTFMAPLRQAATEQHRADMIFFWGGQIAPLVKHRKAAELMEELCRAFV